MPGSAVQPSHQCCWRTTLTWINRPEGIVSIAKAFPTHFEERTQGDPRARPR